VFNDLDALNKLNSMMRIPMLTRIRKEIGRWKGILILNGALLAEAEFLTLCNNNIVVVKSSSENQFKALQKRGLSDEQIIRRMASQLNNCKKLELINSSILNYGHGKVIEINDIYNDDVVWVTMNSICVDGFTKKLS
jgi:dephospho-CoA kinase